MFKAMDILSAGARDALLTDAGNPSLHSPSTQSLSLVKDSFKDWSPEQEQEIWHAITSKWPVDTPPPELGDAHINRGTSGSISSPVREDELPEVAVIGVGYIGACLVRAFAAHFKTIAFDVSKERLHTVASEIVRNLPITYTTDVEDIANATHFIVAVPTLLRQDRTIDPSHLQHAIYTISLCARPGATVILESSVAVGMTRNLLSKMMRIRGVKAGMSPERVDPGRICPAFEDIPKIISGLDDITPGSLRSIERLYSRVFKNIVKVSKPEVAEMTKLYENGQRMMCIAYANEMADACVSHHIDPQEVCSAASTKPYGYMPYSPGLGVGGHCIPINPHYLFSNCEFPLLRAATEMMANRPRQIGDRLMGRLLGPLNAINYRSSRPRILIVGVAFKKGQSEISHSPAVSLIHHLVNHWDAELSFADPLVAPEALPYIRRLDEEREWNSESLESFDLVVVAVNQLGLDFTILDKLTTGKVLHFSRESCS